MNERIDPRVEIGVALMLIVIAALALFGTIGIPPGRFEPMGSAPVPRITAGLILVLSVVVIVRAFVDLRPVQTLTVHRYLDAAVMILLTVAFVAAMHFRLATFAILTTLYLVATIGFLTRFNWRALPVIVVLALVVGFGCQYVFTRIFVIDLPGL